MIRIITDSTSDIPLAEAKKIGIDIIPLKVNFGSDEYIDKYTITNEEFYEKLKSTEQMPTTTLVSPQQFTEVFEKYGEDDVIGIFISHKLSGTYQSAEIAKEESGRSNIYLIDSGTVTIGAALLVEIAVRLRDTGKSAKEIYEKICEYVPKVRIIAVIETLKYLVKGGRLSSTQGLMGSILGIKPIIEVYDGVINSLGKIRGMQNAINFAVEKFHKDYKVDKTQPVAFAHTGNIGDLDYLFSKFENIKDKESHTFSIGSVVGAHSGPGAVAIAFFEE